jgi:hypothetical protein
VIGLRSVWQSSSSGRFTSEPNKICVRPITDWVDACFRPMDRSLARTRIFGKAAVDSNDSH